MTATRVTNPQGTARQGLGATSRRDPWWLVPGIIATSIFSFIVAWNDYLIARIFINTITQMPLTVGVMHFFEGVHVD